MVKTWKRSFVVIVLQLGIVVTMLFCYGCSSIPFAKASYRNVLEVNPALVREDFIHSLPLSFQTVDSIVFKYSRAAIASIGYTFIDTREDIIKAACLNQVGIKLLELEVDHGKITHRFSLDEFSDQGDVVQAVADDIRRIYFDRIPDIKSEVTKRKYEIIFSQPFGSGTLEYVFSGENIYLIEKRYLEGGNLDWAVFYYEYTKDKGSLYPRGIILKNYKYDYELLISLKEIR